MKLAWYFCGLATFGLATVAGSARAADPTPVEANAAARNNTVKVLSPKSYNETDPSPCRTLALVVADLLKSKGKGGKFPALPAKEIEPTLTDTIGTQGSTGQTAAVASGEPVPQTGGTIGLSGTAGSGLQLISALAVNPVGVAADPNDYMSYAEDRRTGILRPPVRQALCQRVPIKSLTSPCPAPHPTRTLPPSRGKRPASEQRLRSSRDAGAAAKRLRPTFLIGRCRGGKPGLTLTVLRPRGSTPGPSA
jgi:hypothetical protein